MAGLNMHSEWRGVQFVLRMAWRNLRLEWHTQTGRALFALRIAEQNLPSEWLGTICAQYCWAQYAHRMARHDLLSE